MKLYAKIILIVYCYYYVGTPLGNNSDKEIDHATNI